MSPDPKKKVAILGGGIAGLSAAFHLTLEEDWQQKYEITVYEQSWRLGGKGASGRNQPDPPADGEQEAPWRSRIEEHGLHVLLGFYDETFELLAESYSYLNALPVEHVIPELHRFAGDSRHLEEVLRTRYSLDQMRQPCDEIHFLEPERTQAPIWTLKLPPRSPSHTQGHFALPHHFWGEALSEVLLENERPSDPNSVHDLLELLLGQEFPPEHASPLLSHEEKRAHLRTLLEWFDKRDEPGFSPGDKELPLMSWAVAQRAARRPQGFPQEERATLVQELRQRRQKNQEALLSQSALTHQDRRDRLLRELRLSICVGLLSEPALHEKKADLSVLDDEDFRQWLDKHGTYKEAIDCAVVQAGYNLTFSQEGQFAAGAALQGVTQLLSYKDHLFYKLKVGMGEAIFAPLYLMLKDKGVHFKFFHRVVALEPHPSDRTTLQTLRLQREKVPRSGEYRPLQEVNGLPCWPVKAFEEQLAPGDGEVTLQYGTDFDQVVLAIPVGALEPICQPLMTAPAGATAQGGQDSPLKTMLRNARTTATQSAQLWFKSPMENTAAANSPTAWDRTGGILASCPEPPFDTWADCSQVLSAETWTTPPQSLVYLCGALPDRPPILPEVKVSLEQQAARWVNQMLPRIWPESLPRSIHHGASTPSVAAEMPDTVIARYCRENTEPWERYVLTPPGSTRFRLEADGSGIKNLLLAGDWVRTRLNTGCLEAAVTAGRQAAQLLTPRAHKSLTPALPPYIEGPNVTNWTGPYHQGDTLLTSFFIQLDKQKLQAFCDTYLNGPLGRPEYTPLGDFGIIQCARINDARSMHPDYQGRGTLHEREIGITIPVVRGSWGASGFVPEHFMLFVPYLFVNTAISLIVGREIYGFPKQLAHIQMPSREGADALFCVSSLDVDQEGQLAKGAELFSVRRSGGPNNSLLPLPPPPSDPTGLAHPAGNDPDLLQRQAEVQLHGVFEQIVDRLSGHLSFDPSELLTALIPPYAMVFLKQFRDVQDFSRACYQSIVEANFNLSHLQASWTLPAEEFKVSFASSGAQSIAAELGVPPGISQTPLLAIALKVDFTLHEGQPRPGGPIPPPAG